MSRRQAATDATPPARLLRDEGVDGRRLDCLGVDGGIGVDGRGVRLGGVRIRSPGSIAGGGACRRRWRRSADDAVGSGSGSGSFRSGPS